MADTTEGKDSLILPGLIEMHIHGAFGIGFEAVKGPEDLLLVRQLLLRRGVSRFVPTILWNEHSLTSLVRAILESGLYRGAIPGIYMEGPFVNAAKRGGIGVSQIAEPEVGLCNRILDLAKGMLRIMTVAPELPGIEKIYEILERNGVMVSLGHSNAKGSVPLPDKPFSVTHLFNAMSGVDHREGGLANIALSNRAAWVELNADGIHVTESAMKIASLCIPPGHLILTSDAVVSAGLSHGEYAYFGKKVFSDPSGVRYVDTQTLIGSNRLGMDVITSFIKATGVSLEQAVVSMSDTPANLLGLKKDPTDFFVWDTSLKTCSRREAL